MKNEDNYKYSVAAWCSTYNQKKYIEDTLRGFAMQEASVPMVFIIIDDASTDGEPEKLRKWALDNLDFKTSANLWIKQPYGYLAEAPLKGKPDSLFVIILLFGSNYIKRYMYNWF